MDERVTSMDARRGRGELTSQNKARLSLKCLAQVTGLADCGDSMTGIAKRHGVPLAAATCGFASYHAAP